jgi:uncharacterized membrane protein
MLPTAVLVASHIVHDGATRGGTFCQAENRFAIAPSGDVNAAMTMAHGVEAGDTSSRRQAANI